MVINKKVTIITQARLGSSRFPNKILKTINGKLPPRQDRLTWINKVIQETQNFIAGRTLPKIGYQMK